MSSGSKSKILDEEVNSTDLIKTPRDISTCTPIEKELSEDQIDLQSFCKESILNDILNESIAEVTSKQENQANITYAIKKSFEIAWESACMGGTLYDVSMDDYYESGYGFRRRHLINLNQVVSSTSINLKSYIKRCRRRKRKEQEYQHENDDDVTKAFATTSTSTTTTTTTAGSLRELLNSFEQNSRASEFFLGTFTGSRLKMAVNPTKHPPPQWSLDIEKLSDFLFAYARIFHVSLMPSDIRYILETNQNQLERKQRNGIRLSLDKIQLLLEKTLLSLEEEEEEEEEQDEQEEEEEEEELNKCINSKISNISPKKTNNNKQKKNKYKTTSMATTTSTTNNTQDPEEDVYLKLYFGWSLLEEKQPTATEIDRIAPKYVQTRRPRPPPPPLLSTDKSGQQYQMVNANGNGTSGGGGSSVWRKHVHPIDKNSVLHITTFETDISIHHTEGEGGGERKGQIATTTTTTTAADLLSKLNGGPDNAALCNIFALGTPRQLPVNELARRNDILSILEREEAKKSKKKHSSLDDGAPNKTLSSFYMTKQEFHAHVAANFEVITLASSGAASSESKRRQRDVALDDAAVASSSFSKKNKSKGSKDNKKKKTMTKYDALHLQVGRVPVTYQLECGLKKNPQKNTTQHEATAINGEKVTKNRPVFEMSMEELFRLDQRQQKESGSNVDVGQRKIDKQEEKEEKKEEENTFHDSFRPFSDLPQLDLTKLNTGVKAVMKGIESKGPKRNPSRNSRLRLHNYYEKNDEQVVSTTTAATTITTTTSTTNITTAIEEEDGIGQQKHVLPTLSVSPLKAKAKAMKNTSPVAFIADFAARQHSLTNTKEKEEQEEDFHQTLCHRRFPIQQPVWENTNQSPPRIRNRFFIDVHTQKRPKNDPKKKNKKKIRKRNIELCN